MPILRSLQGFAKINKVKGLKDRDPEDFDLRWAVESTTFSVYLIDAHEWFDPRTSTKYDGPGGISRHAYKGPSMIVSTQGIGSRIDEHYVNDPETWGWIRSSIKKYGDRFETRQ